ncbi:intradiol ring-cleavage dioxygenase [Roseococcus sp. DSY-14]|uniref:intradiol ring-cleavage dioxygenase n=1 Tax=Roseococcus sp. DSY-14 TaxID=3369650 RepID=UPI00387AAD9C
MNEEDAVTAAVLARMGGCPEPRARELSTALVRHLHAFLKEVRPTQEEWMRAIQFLTATGQMCSDHRQEFILLSDTLGASMLVDAINNPTGGLATDSTVLGPFYVAGPPELPLGADIAKGRAGEPMRVEGVVRGPDGAPIADAWMDTWHSDEEGFYDVQRGEQPELNLRARFRTDAQGRFHFRSIVPTFYPVPHDGPVGAMLLAQGRHPFRPAHVHFMLGAPGCRTLVTHVFLEGDPYLESDAVFGVKPSLVTSLDRSGPEPVLRYDFTLAAA